MKCPVCGGCGSVGAEGQVIACPFCGGTGTLVVASADPEPIIVPIPRPQSVTLTTEQYDQLINNRATA